MKVLLISGGAMVIGIWLTVLAVLYYPYGLLYFNSIPINKAFKKESYKGMTFLRGFGTFGGGLIFSILSVGTLFKLLQLPGATVMLNIGLTAGTLFLVATFVKYSMNRDSSFLRKMLIRTIIIIGVSGILVATPGLTLVKIFHRDNPEYIKTYEQSTMNPNDLYLQKKS